MYSVYVLDYDGTYVKLDTQDVDIKMIYNVADYTDIEKRQDTQTGEIKFPDTAVNRAAFNNLFHLNSYVNTNLENKLNFNFSGSRKVSCVIYEDEIKILDGTLYISECVLNDGSIVYSGVATGRVVDFFSYIKTKQLNDLDVSDYSHSYTIDAITQSWSGYIQTFNPISFQTSYTHSDAGYGYVYPHQDLGYQLAATNSNYSVINHNIRNYQPCMYVWEVLDRIVGQAISASGSTAAGGYTFEVKSATLTDRLKKLILQPGLEIITESFTPITGSAQIVCQGNVTGGGSVSVQHSSNAAVDPWLWSFNSLGSLVNYQTKMDASDTYNGLFMRSIENGSQANCYFPYFTHNTQTDGQISFRWDAYKLLSPDMTLIVELVTRDYAVQSKNGNDGWTVLGSDTRLLSGSGLGGGTRPDGSYYGLFRGTSNFTIPRTSFKKTQQIAIRTRIICPSGVYYLILDVWSGYTFKCPLLGSEMLYEPTGPETPKVNALPDFITPKLPSDMTQFDFIKGIMNMFNVYCYSDASNPRHLIFDTYDGFYSMASTENKKSYALNWSNKVDLKNIKTIPNNTIPKSYLFTYKEDGDFINSAYKSQYNEVYGTKTLTNSQGFTGQKKVELKFAISPESQFDSADRLLPVITKDSGYSRKQTKYVPRLVYFNGSRPTGSSFYIGSDTFTASTGAIGFTNSMPVYVLPFNYFANVTVLQSNYGYTSEYYTTSTFSRVETLAFDKPDRVYWNVATQSIIDNISTLYDNYYENQITEFVDPNLKVYEFQVNLSKSDLPIDLRVPIFVDLGKWGHGYFKLLKVEYNGSSEQLSKVTAQLTVDNLTNVIPDAPKELGKWGAMIGVQMGNRYNMTNVTFDDQYVVFSGFFFKGTDGDYARIGLHNGASFSYLPMTSLTPDSTTYPNNDIIPVMYNGSGAVYWHLEVSTNGIWNVVSPTYSISPDFPIYGTKVTLGSRSGAIPYDISINDGSLGFAGNLVALGSLSNETFVCSYDTATIVYQFSGSLLGHMTNNFGSSLPWSGSLVNGFTVSNTNSRLTNGLTIIPSSAGVDSYGTFFRVNYQTYTASTALFNNAYINMIWGSNTYTLLNSVGTTP